MTAWMCTWMIDRVMCGREATCTHPGTGQPRCADHGPARWVVWIGSSLYVTRNEHQWERDALREAETRLAPALLRQPEERRRERMTARRATTTDIERWDTLIAQEQLYRSRRAIKDAARTPDEEE